VVHGQNVGVIRYSDGQHRVDTGMRDRLLARRSVLRDEHDDVGIDFVILQGNVRNAVLAGEYSSDVIVGYEAHLRQAASQLASIGALKFERLLELVLSDQAFLNKYFAQTDGHPRYSRRVCTQRPPYTM